MNFVEVIIDFMRWKHLDIPLAIDMGFFIASQVVFYFFFVILLRMKTLEIYMDDMNDTVEKMKKKLTHL